MKSLRSLGALVVLPALVALSVAPATAFQLVDPRPNIVLVLVDDLGDIDERLLRRLPNISRVFLDQGVRFENAFVETPLCCPARAGILTGTHTTRHGVVDTVAALFDPSVTVATELQEVGYYTLLAGKFMMGFGNPSVDKHPPGWTHFAASVNEGNGYTAQDWWVDGVPLALKGHHSDVLKRLGLGFIRQAPADMPIFAMLTPFAPHVALGPTGSHAIPAPRHRRDARCQGIGRWASPAYNEADVLDKPSHINSDPAVPYTAGWPLTRICESLLSVDQMVGAVIAELTVQGRLENTILLFASDNGMSWGDHRQRGKMNPYSTGIPLYATWPAARGTLPRVESQHVMNIDLAPTLCGIAGCDMGPFADGVGADGIDVSALLRDEPVVLPRDAVLESFPKDKPLHTPAWRAVRTTAQSLLGPWHYVEYVTGERELYDLAADPWELTNLAGDEQYADVEAALAQRLAELGERPTRAF